LARAIGHPLVVDDELAMFVFEMCTDAAFLRERGRSFAPQVPVDPGEPTLDRLAGLLGRHP
jgi:hypothetical protein